MYKQPVSEVLKTIADHFHDLAKKEDNAELKSILVNCENSTRIVMGKYKDKENKSELPPGVDDDSV